MPLPCQAWSKKEKKNPTNPQPALDDQERDAQKNIFYKKCCFQLRWVAMVLRLIIMRKLHEKVNTNFKIIMILSLKMEPLPGL